MYISEVLERWIKNQDNYLISIKINLLKNCEKFKETRNAIKVKEYGLPAAYDEEINGNTLLSTLIRSVDKILTEDIFYGAKMGEDYSQELNETIADDGFKFLYFYIFLNYNLSIETVNKAFSSKKYYSFNDNESDTISTILNTYNE